MAFAMRGMFPLYLACSEFVSWKDIKFCQILFQCLLRWSHGFYSSLCYCSESHCGCWTIFVALISLFLNSVFSCLIALVRTSGKKLKWSDKSRYPCLIHNLCRKFFSLSSLSMVLVRIFTDDFLPGWKFLSLPSLLSVFNILWNGVHFFLKYISKSIEIIFLYTIDMAY